MNNKKLTVIISGVIAVLTVISIIGLANSTITVTVKLPDSAQTTAPSDSSSDTDELPPSDEANRSGESAATVPSADGDDTKTPTAVHTDNVTEAQNPHTPTEAVKESDSEKSTQKPPAAQEPENAPKTEKPASSQPAASALNKEQAVELYNKAANRIKKEASSITRNYKKLSSVDKYLKLPSAIQGLGSAAMKQFVKGSDKPETYTAQEDKNIVFPVGGTDYTSNLTADMVKTASVTDTGNEYKISFVLYDDKITSPEKGKGYAGVFNTVTASTFNEINIPTVTFEKVNVNGVGGAISCTVNKVNETISEITFKNTDILDLSVKVAIKTLDVKLALAVEENYTVKY